jgi:hypothetical protein
MCRDMSATFPAKVDGEEGNADDTNTNDDDTNVVANNAALDDANYAAMPMPPKVKPPTEKPIYCRQRDAATHTALQQCSNCKCVHVLLTPVF